MTPSVEPCDTVNLFYERYYATILASSSVTSMLNPFSRERVWLREPAWLSLWYPPTMSFCPVAPEWKLIEEVDEIEGASGAMRRFQWFDDSSFGCKRMMPVSIVF